MSKYEKKDSFEKYGFRIVRGILNPEEIIEIRKKIDEVYLKSEKKYFKYSNRYLLSDAFLENKELSFIYQQIMFNEKVVSSLKEALGNDMTYFSDINLQRNMFGGWHTDVDSEKRSPYLLDDNYRFAKCAMLLQDNTKEFGGFVDVLPKSHVHYKNLLKVNRNPIKIFKQVYSGLLLELKIKFFPFTVPAKAGDLVFFDYRLLHSATKPRAIENWKNIPSDRTKYMFYWNSCHNDMVDTFLKHSQFRSILHDNNEESFFTVYLANCYPDDYPQDFVDSAKKSQVNIASLDKGQSEIFKKIQQQYID